MSHIMPVSFQAGGQGLQGVGPQPKTLCLCYCGLTLKATKHQSLTQKVKCC